MNSDAKPFVPRRLMQARERTGLPISALARLLGVSRQTIDNYEKGKSNPNPQTVQKIAEALQEDVRFFYAPTLVTYEHDGVFFRDAARNRQADQKAAGRELEGITEYSYVLTKFVNFPDANLPELDFPANPREVQPERIEEAAEALREHWNLGLEPIRNLTRAAERNGVLIQRFVLDNEDLDALSMWSDELARPVVLLNDLKQSNVRSRFDLAHELGHVLMHRAVAPELRNEPTVHKALERQAHAFAGALLLPRTTWAPEVGEVTLMGLLQLKMRWQVSVAAQLSRAKALGLVSSDRFVSLYKQLSKRGWRRKEPLDETLELERPVLIRKATEMVAQNSPSGLYSVWSKIPRRVDLVANHAGVPREFFDPMETVLSLKREVLPHHN